MCDIPSIAGYSSEYVEYFPGIASRFSLKLFVTIPMTPTITGIFVHFKLYIIIIIIIIIQFIQICISRSI
jgi:hypothetical protein